MINLLKFLFKITAATTVVMITIMTSFFIMLIFLGLLTAAFAESDDREGLLAQKEFVFGTEGSGNELLIIDIQGVIMGERELTDPWLSSLDFGTTYGYEIKDTLIEAAEDDAIKGIVLVTNSPGGTIFGSQAILEGVQYYKEQTNRPVIAFVSGIAASGSYWAVANSDEIIADHGTTVGSIGIIFGPFKYYDTVTSEDGGIFMGGVVTEQGIQTTYITAGRSKDLGNPYRQLTTEETTKLQAMVNESYQEFVQVISEHRDLEPSEIVNDIGALVYGENSAQRLGLIDAVGSREQAFYRLAERAGVVDNFSVMRVNPEMGFWDALMSAQFLAQLTNSQAANQVSPARQQICTLNSTLLAYHGDPQSLCQ